MDVFALLVKVSGPDAENIGSALLKQSGDEVRENVARWLAHEVTRIVGRCVSGRKIGIDGADRSTGHRRQRTDMRS